MDYRAAETKNKRRKTRKEIIVFNLEVILLFLEKNEYFIWGSQPRVTF